MNKKDKEQILDISWQLFKKTPLSVKFHMRFAELIEALPVDNSVTIKQFNDVCKNNFYNNCPCGLEPYCSERELEDLDLEVINKVVTNEDIE